MDWTKGWFGWDSKCCSTAVMLIGVTIQKRDEWHEIVMRILVWNSWDGGHGKGESCSWTVA